MRTILLVFCLCVSFAAFSQTTVSGNVVDESSVPILGANVIVAGTSSGTATDYDGNFSLLVDQQPPFTLQISSIGFASQEVEVTSNNQTISVIFSGRF